MISIALVLLLIVGINFVFQMTTDAVGAGQTANTFARDSQSAQTILFDDFRNIDRDAPCFIIASQLVTQFLNSADAQTGSDPREIVVDSTDWDWIGNTTAGMTPPAPPTVTVTLLSPAILNYRSHRADMVKFFAHGYYQRHSGNDGAFTSQTTATDAFITLGHAMLPINDGSVYVGPTTDSLTIPGHLVENYNDPTFAPWTPFVRVTGAGPQQRLGAYAADWVLARSVILLKDLSTNLTPANAIIERNYPRYPYTLNGTTFAFPASVPYAANMTPLGCYSPDDANASVVESSRYDLANVTPDQVRRAIADEVLQWRAPTGIPPYTGPHLWWNPLVYNLAAYENAIGVGLPGPAPYMANASPPVYYFANTATGAAAPPTYQFGIWTVTSGVGALNPVNDDSAPQGAPPNHAVPQPAPDLARVACNPRIQTPLDSASIAQMAPYFLQHCSQFIVEYAGDYLQQDGATSVTPGVLTGQITGLGPDGQIDYVIATDAAGNRHKRIRWYGMPRSSNGGTPNTYPWDTNAVGTRYVIRGYSPGLDRANATYPDLVNPAITHGIMEEFVDVIPLRDYYSMYLNTVNGATNATARYYVPPWEVDVNFDSTADYATNPQPSNPPGGFGFNNAFHVNINDDTTHTPPSPQNNARYVAAWYNDMPAMIRILIKVDDPNDKLKVGPWYEYIFRLK